MIYCKKQLQGCKNPGVILHPYFFEKARTYKGFSRQECKDAMIFLCLRAYATFRAKVIKIPYRSIVRQFQGKITRCEKATAVLCQKEKGV